MTKQLKIQDLIPFMEKGWVAMDKDGYWMWFQSKPKINVEDEEWDGTSLNLAGLGAFNIAPVEDWTKSLIEVGE